MRCLIRPPYVGSWWAVGLLILGCLANQDIEGKEPDLTAARAIMYQAATVPVLRRHHWKVILDRPGKLVADQPYNTPGGFFGPNAFSIQLVRLTISFTPETSKHTQCKAVIVGYSHARRMQEDKLGMKTYTSTLVGPFPMDIPDNVKETRAMMAEAESGLISNHPEFASR